MARMQLAPLLCLSLMCAISPTLAADPQKTPKELLQYVEEAKRLGLKDEEIRQNAVAAGWNKEKVGEALAIMNYVSENPGRSPSGSTPATPGAPRKTVSEPSGYRIGAGDVLQIVVWKEPEASVPSVVVRTDGKISVPLIKEVEVAGLTIGETEAMLTEKLGKLIRDVDVTVVPKEITSRKVYLVGAVRKEGPIQLQSTMTILQALNSAGGLTEYAKRKKIYLLRNENGKQIRLPFDYEAVIRGERPEQNIPVRPEDTIVVP